MKCLLPIVFLSVLLISCSENINRLEPFRWESTEPDFDAVTLELEQDFMDYLPVDSLSEKVEMLEHLSESCDSGDVRHIRSHYWRARLLSRAGYKDSALMLITTSMAMIDSVRYTYDFFRFRSLLRQMSKTRGVRSYHEIDEEMRFYSSVGDAPMTAAIYINFGTNLYHIGEHDKSLEYMRKADEINRELGYHKTVAKNAINIANIQFRRGNSDEGEAILLDLLEDPEITGDAYAYNLVLRNLYAHTDDVSWLLMAYRTVEDSEAYRDMQGEYEVFLSSYYDHKGQADSAVIKMHIAGGEEWDTFQQLFVKVNPDFISRLHAAYPALSDSYVRLATYIYMGLDNNKIARLLVIRPESVKQARWRLRRMMGLDKDTPLDDAIKSLGDVKTG